MESLRKNPAASWMLAALAFLALTYVPMFMSPEIVDAFVREDRIYEVLSSLYLFVTSVLFAIAFFQSRARFDLRDPLWIRKMIFLGFAALFFLAAGEEISWGQRIFGFETPNLIKDHNVQKELTLHNLNFFQGENRLIPLSFGQMAAMFALGFGAALPLACKFIPALNRWVNPIFPVLPAITSVLFIGNYLIQKAIVRTIPIFPQLYHNPDLGFRAALLETREHGYEFALMVATMIYVFVKLRTPPEAGRSTIEAAAPDGH